MGRIEIIRHWRSCTLAMCLSVLSFNASAFVLVLAKVADGYDACTWRNNGNGTSTLNIKIQYRQAAGNLGGGIFTARGILIYTYDRLGKLRPSSAVAKSVKINDTAHSGVFLGDNYAMYYGTRPQWTIRDPYTANVEVLIDNTKIKDWPAVAIRAGNFTQGNDVGEVTGGAYLTMANNNGGCLVLDPSQPPPQPPLSIVVDAAAPDWDLGELPRGDSQKTLVDASQQLCFTYTGFESYLNFVINATNANGMSGNRFLLRNTSKPEQTVPYSVTLNSGSANFPLPNIGASAIRLNAGNRTCFVPTFKASVGMSAGAGDYSDVLLFTVVTKS